MPVGDGSLHAGVEDDDLLADASALLADDPEDKALKPKKKVAIKRDTPLPTTTENKTM